MVFTSKTKDAVSQTVNQLLDPKMEFEHYKMTMAQICMDDSPKSSKILQEMRARASQQVAEQNYLKKTQELDELIGMMKAGPIRRGRYVGPCPAVNGSEGHRVEASLENGDTAFPLVLDEQLLESLRCGDAILLDAQARMVIAAASDSCTTGEVAELVRRLGDDTVRVRLNDLNSEAYRMSDTLKEQFESGEVEPGAEVLVCTRQRMAFAALPPEDGHAHYRFLERGILPEVDVQRDIGCPKPFIEELIQHVHDEMVRPELGEKYKVRRSQTRLLKGITGSGKTLSILGVIHGIKQVMSDVTGAPLDQLPNRVLRLRSADYLNKYVGQSDKALDRFFNEMIQLADEPFYWEGKEYFLPVIARCEEIDALARARNGSEDVMGRIQTTALERLDHLSDDLGNKLCIFLFTTNTPQICDQAFLRRAGGQIIDFGRIGRGELQAILAKKVRGLPLHVQLGADQQQAEQRLVREATNWLFSTNGHDPGQVEITFAGSATPTVKYRRDVLTGAVVDLSVQQAAQEAKVVERDGTDTPGLTTEMLLAAFHSQIRSIVEQITEYNAPNYLALPDGARVGAVRRIEQPAVQPFELERSDR
ncbi:MAG: ATP-binding protein [Pirellulales bacterium]